MKNYMIFTAVAVSKGIPFTCHTAMLVIIDNY